MAFASCILSISASILSFGPSPAFSDGFSSGLPRVPSAPGASGDDPTLPLPPGTG